jgi:hypothetical protein
MKERAGRRPRQEYGARTIRKVSPKPNSSVELPPSSYSVNVCRSHSTVFRRQSAGNSPRMSALALLAILTLCYLSAHVLAAFVGWRAAVGAELAVAGVIALLAEARRT